MADITARAVDTRGTDREIWRGAGVARRGLTYVGDRATSAALELWIAGVAGTGSIARLRHRNHPFIDGNKRTGFFAIAVFLRWNGVPFRPDQDDATNTILKLASGDLTEAHLADWVTDVISASA